MLEDRIAKLTREYLNYARELRQAFHQCPELSFQEVKTARMIARELEQSGIDCWAGCGSRTSLLATVRGRKEGRCVLLRADLDGLPIVEATGLPFASRHSGVMHACGHDGHMAGLLAVARILDRLQDELHGTVKLAFEAGVENGGAAQAMIAAGALENPVVDAAFATHFFGSIPEGEVVVPKRYAFTSCDTVNIAIHGIGGHSSQPHRTIDPVLIAGQLIALAQAAVARTIPAMEPGVLTFSTIHGGELYNVIPETVLLTGSIRMLREDIREKIHSVLEGLLEGLTAAYGATFEISYTNSLPAALNEPELSAFAAGSLGKSLPEYNVYLRDEPEMASETYAYFSRVVPSCYFMIGVDAGDQLPQGAYKNHSTTFQWREAVLEAYIRGMAQLAVDYLMG